MKRMVICTLACLLIATSSEAQESKFKSLWPFAKDKATPSKFSSINPFSSGTKPAASEKRFTWPSPTKMIDSAERRTESVFQKTRETWRSVQDLGRAMNPFAGSTAKKEKKSFLDTFFPKQEVNRSPADVNDFLSMDRPGF